MRYSFNEHKRLNLCLACGQDIEPDKPRISCIEKSADTSKTIGSFHKKCFDASQRTYETLRRIQTLCMDSSLNCTEALLLIHEQAINGQLGIPA